jgi:hypothetical protein
MLDYLKRLFNLRCKHKRVRCIHGDEIILAGWRRSQCLDCLQTFDNLPEICSNTGVQHPKPKKPKTQ